jgi:hypothetical protein
MPIDFSNAANIRNVNNGNLGVDPRQVLRLSSSLQKCKNFGKAWDVGDQGTVFYPFKWWPDASLPSGGSFEPHMSAYFGHQVSDMKVLGTTFLRSLSRIDENGQVIGEGDLAYQFSKIAGLLVNAQKERELHELNAKDWTILGQTAYQQARAKVEEKYNTKENMNAKKALIGRLTVLKLTEVVYVAMDPNSGTPIFDDQRKQKTGTYIQTLSDNRLSKLRALANDVNCGIMAQNPGLEPVEGEVYFLEVLYNFTSAKNSKSEAGRVDPQGVAHSVTILSRNPGLKSKLEEWLQRVPKDPDGISAHTYNMAPMPDEVLKAKLQAVMFESTAAMPYMTPEDKDRLVRNAQLLDYLRIAPKEDPDLNARLTEALGHPVGEAPSAEAPTVDTIMNGDSPDYRQQHVDLEKIQAHTDEFSDDLLGDGIGVDLGGGGV